MYGEYEEEVLEKLHKIELMMLDDFMKICDSNQLEYFAISGSAIGAVRHKGFIPWDDDIDIAMLREDYEKFVKIIDEDKDFSQKYELWGPDRKEKYYNLQPTLVLKGTVFVNESAAAAGFKPGILMDIFVYDNIPDNPEEAKKIIKKCRTYKILYILRNINAFKRLKGQTVIGKIKNVISGILRLFLRLIPKGDEFLFKKYTKYASMTEGKSDTYTCLFDPGSHIMDIRRSQSFPTIEVPFENTKIRLLKNYDEQLRKHMGSYMEIPPENKRTNHKPVELDFGEYV